MTKVYLALLRGINVGGKNKVPMAELKACFEELGCENVRTYIASGNVMFESNKSSAELTEEIQESLPKKFKLDSELIKILVLSRDQLQKVIDQAPKGFGTEPGKYHSDAIFLMGIPSGEAIKSLTQEKALIRSGKEIWPSTRSASPLNVREAAFLKSCPVLSINR